MLYKIVKSQRMLDKKLKIFWVIFREILKKFVGDFGINFGETDLSLQFIPPNTEYNPGFLELLHEISKMSIDS